MAELLFELLSEEIPARMQARAAADLKRLVCEGLKKERLDFESAESFVTPRRLALVVYGLPPKQPDESEDKRGPRVGSPEQAIRGFLNSVGKTFDDLERRETEKGEFYFVVIFESGEATGIILSKVLNSAVRDLPWPKSMRWHETVLKQTFRWVRPLRHVLGIFDGKPIIGGITTVGTVGHGNDLGFTNETLGHWILAPEVFPVRNFQDYKQRLRDAFVIVDQEERQEKISFDIRNIIADENLRLQDDPELLNEVTGLVEYPVVLMGDIDNEFMSLPAEVLTTVMRQHQKYFALLDKKGKLAPKFIVVANTVTPDNGEVVIAGNERVLRARLSDAKFFWDQDRMQSLESRTQKLADRVFHAQLGTIFDKVLRIENLAIELATNCAADKDSVGRAASLCKADLSTGMVSELPKLQGVMGRYYALHDGEMPEVADAIAEHYSPLGPNDRCPNAPESVTVALADKIDTLVGFWLIDEKPTGSKDPYALRRAALGVIRLILENELRISLLPVFECSYDLYQDLPKIGEEEEEEEEEEELNGGETEEEEGSRTVAKDLLNFFVDRLKVQQREKGLRHDLVEAVFTSFQQDDLVHIVSKANALKVFLKTNDGENLLISYRRAENIVRAEEKKDYPKPYRGLANFELLKEIEEINLWKMLDELGRDIRSLLTDDEFEAALTKLASLRAPVDAFFDHVTVNCEDDELRENRLLLLSEISSCMNHVAEFSAIEG